MASVGIGSGQHIAGELFKMMAGINMVHEPYRGGGPTLTDLLGGQVQVMFPGAVVSIEHIRAGRLRALAVAKQCWARLGTSSMSDLVNAHKQTQLRRQAIELMSGSAQRFAFNSFWEVKLPH
jgi:tripartite-type tricarboxylate transporter receptor subunit TctC